ncbi:SPASM domain-containing protein [Candidatus Electrothrix sp.]|uniref:SPASM domain-containing protein n=1 Tax=Candidatus Electrothrix sp. TaxID=2170559 RepID=UPI0040564A77
MTDNIIKTDQQANQPPSPFSKAIHLLYVPTTFCNMRCRYCYLGDLTAAAKPDPDKVLGTLNTALEQLLAHGYLPFNLSFHGGEVTTLSSELLDGLFSIAARHYAHYGEKIKAQSFRVSPPHIKTNLFDFQRHWDVFVKHRVSISGSVDLPLRLHEQFRRDRQGRSTLNQIRKNLKLLAAYPHNKKISCVVTRAHLEAVEDFIAEIKYLHDEIGLDMSRFNVMFGFDSAENKNKFQQLQQQDQGAAMLTDAEQVRFYQAVKKAFVGTSLENPLRTEWFKEFTPEFCCSSINCGGKFFLLQFDGEVFSCPRGQSSPAYRYGNIFTDGVEAVINNGWNMMERNENLLDIDDDCACCPWLAHCNLGCTFVRQETGLRKSYTCLLQKQLYQDAPDRWPPLPPEKIAAYAQRLFLNNNLKKLQRPLQSPYTKKERVISPELFDDTNTLNEIIRRDTKLQALYSDELFFLRINGVEYRLRSAILKNEMDIEVLDKSSTILLGVREDVFSLACNDEINNYVHLMLLRDTAVVYGDEQRSKQEHIFDYSFYRNAFFTAARQEGNYALLDISQLLISHAQFYLEGVRNNLFITTKTLREYHYSKHRKNAFYHIQAINLPFQNIEFYWHENN